MRSDVPGIEEALTLLRCVAALCCFRSQKLGEVLCTIALRKYLVFDFVFATSCFKPFLVATEVLHFCVVVYGLMHQCLIQVWELR